MVALCLAFRGACVLAASLPATSVGTAVPAHTVASCPVGGRHQPVSSGVTEVSISVAPVISNAEHLFMYLSTMRVSGVVFGKTSIPVLCSVFKRCSQNQRQGAFSLCFTPVVLQFLGLPFCLCAFWVGLCEWCKTGPSFTPLRVDTRLPRATREETVVLPCGLPAPW